MVSRSRGEFPPHSRGWTPTPTGSRRGGSVSPALAGMDPSKSVVPPSPSGFPRTRGDGPSAAGTMSRLGPFPPHSRGWTRNLRLDGLVGRVSPALAGMDPWRPGSRLRAQCFPRTRGDGPKPEPAGLPPMKFPPHSRGWTPECRRPRRRAGVSPALAGMDPLGCCSTHHPTSFPRTRGDGPREGHGRTKEAPFPPHSRGWTARAPGPGQRVAVSPALAGMDPPRSPGSCTWTCFPRTRGDGPSRLRRVLSVSRFPPHSRGWTQEEAGILHETGVSPALAGMDRPRRRGHVRRGGFPRTRGDGPFSEVDILYAMRFPPHSRGWTRCGARLRTAQHVSPALAGMDPSGFMAARTIMCFPRTRGDGPVSASSSSAGGTFPPHSRGWTHPAVIDLSLRGVSPALAGMDPTVHVDELEVLGFPRTRGDGPPSSHPAAPSFRFPPHSRGWTAELADHLRADAVSPALAGMDPSCPTPSWCRRRFPRTRGDGPPSSW